METLYRYVAAPTRCGYRPDQQWSLEYEHVGAMTLAEYQVRLLQNWRRFGTVLFRPACAACTACRSLRVPVATFRPDRSQRRCRTANVGVTLRIGPPAVTSAKLRLYDRYHAFQADHKGWPRHPARDPDSYADSFVHHPFPIEEWCFYLGRRLIGIGYVDCLPPAAGIDPRTGRRGLVTIDGAALAGGLSAIYFFYDPDERKRAPGTWNVLCQLDEAARRGLPYVYLGYYVEGCASMAYKPRFSPNELRGDDGVWRPFRT